MILIIEGGSSTMDWAIISDSEVIAKGSEQGNNPLISEEIEFPDAILLFKDSIVELNYYGAGVSTKNTIARIEIECKNIIPQLVSVFVASDLLAASRASYGNDSGIIGILGTGSNIAYYNGNKLEYATPSLGYVLGDEGSGYAIGKAIILSYFHQLMDLSDRKLFEETYAISKEELLHKVYQESKPNRFIASFSKFLNFASETLKSNVLRSVFDDYIKYRVNPCITLFANKTSKKIILVGSIATQFEVELKEHFAQHNISITKVIKSPIDELINYHKNNNNE